MADLLARHHDANPAGKYRPVDMLAFNELLLQRTSRAPARGEASDAAPRAANADGAAGCRERTLGAHTPCAVVSGFPIGPVNLPMSSAFCGPLPTRYDACLLYTSPSPRDS